MTDDRSIERAARSWLEAGPTRAPDDAILAALNRIDTTPQERDWPSPLADVWERLARQAVPAVAALAIVLLGGWLVFQRGPGPEPAVSPPPSPTASASPSAPPSASSSAQPEAGGPPMLRRPSCRPDTATPSVTRPTGRSHRHPRIGSPGSSTSGGVQPSMSCAARPPDLSAHHNRWAPAKRPTSGWTPMPQAPVSPHERAG